MTDIINSKVETERIDKKLGILNARIEIISNGSLVRKFRQLCHIRGEKQALAKNIEEDLDLDIAVGEREIIKRLECNENFRPKVMKY